MKNFYILLILLTIACGRKDLKNESAKNDSIAIDTSSTLEKAAIKSDDYDENMDSDEENFGTYFIVELAEGYNYDSLERLAKDASKELGFEYSTFNRYYNPQKGIVLPDDYDDDIWAGNYYFRRVGGEIVSIEKKNHYLDFEKNQDEEYINQFSNDSTRMFVFVTMYDERKTADSLLNLLKPKFPNAKVFGSEIYMGCMH